MTGTGPSLTSLRRTLLTGTALAPALLLLGLLVPTPSTAQPGDGGSASADATEGDATASSDADGGDGGEGDRGNTGDTLIGNTAAVDPAIPVSAGAGFPGPNGAAGQGFGGDGGAITVKNRGPVHATGAGVHAEAIGPVGTNPIMISNWNVLYGGTKGIFASGPTRTDIVNEGYISAKSLFAIDTVGASTKIDNKGEIFGFVDLTDMDDTFLSRSGGVFNARKTSHFRDGNDLFANSGTVQTAGKRALETTKFVGLERFENRGLISLQDGREGDVFQISNTPGATDLTYAASGNSTLGVDAFLGGRGSKSDIFIIDGDVKGRTAVAVNDTNPGPGALNPRIPVVFANGKIASNAFYLAQPIDKGLFAYDLFFKPTGSGIFELRGSPAQAPKSCRNFSRPTKTPGGQRPIPGSTGPPICGCC